MLLDDIADATENPTPKWSDNEIATQAWRQLQEMSRIQVQRDEGFHNFMLCLKGSNATNVVTGVFQWALPPWIMAICDVRLRALQSDEENFSPYTFAAPLIFWDVVPKKRKNFEYGWRWDGNRTLQLWGYGAAPDLALWVAKAPARFFRGVLDKTGNGKRTIYLPSTLTIGTEALEEGAYVNAEVQVVAVEDDTSSSWQNVGIQRRVIYSAAANEIDATRQTILTFDEEMPQDLLIGDTIESALPLGEEHCRLLMLKTAWVCFEKTNNIPGQKSIQGELAAQAQAFSDFVTPRDHQEPGTVVSELPHGYTRPYDANRAWRNAQ